MDPETGMPHTPAVRATEGGSSRPMQLMARKWVQWRRVLSLLVVPVVTWVVIVIVNIAVSGLFNAPVNLSPSELTLCTPAASAGLGRDDRPFAAA